MGVLFGLAVHRFNGANNYLSGAGYTWQIARAQWGGGEAIELAITPERARYAARDFLWRVNSATVELDESDYTPLPDYERLITPLRGDMVLQHGSGEPATLRPYEIRCARGHEGK